jgi:hypothetical protein
VEDGGPRHGGWKCGGVTPSAGTGVGSCEALSPARGTTRLLGGRNEPLPQLTETHKSFLSYP